MRPLGGRLGLILLLLLLLLLLLQLLHLLHFPSLLLLSIRELHMFG